MSEITRKVGLIIGVTTSGDAIIGKVNQDLATLEKTGKSYNAVTAATAGSVNQASRAQGNYSASTAALKAVVGDLYPAMQRLGITTVDQARAFFAQRDAVMQAQQAMKLAKGTSFDLATASLATTQNTGRLARSMSGMMMVTNQAQGIFMLFGGGGGALDQTMSRMIGMTNAAAGVGSQLSRMKQEGTGFNASLGDMFRASDGVSGKLSMLATTFGIVAVAGFGAYAATRKFMEALELDQYVESAISSFGRWSGVLHDYTENQKQAASQEDILLQKIEDKMKAVFDSAAAYDLYSQNTKIMHENQDALNKAAADGVITQEELGAIVKANTPKDAEAAKAISKYKDEIKLYTLALQAGIPIEQARARLMGEAPEKEYLVAKRLKDAYDARVQGSKNAAKALAEEANALEKAVESIEAGVKAYLDAKDVTEKIIPLTGNYSDELQGLGDSAARTAVETEHLSGAAEETGKTWLEFMSERMGPYMKKFGSHGAAIAKIAEEWKLYKAGLLESIPAIENTKGAVIELTDEMAHYSDTVAMGFEAILGGLMSGTEDWSEIMKGLLADLAQSTTTTLTDSLTQYFDYLQKIAAYNKAMQAWQAGGSQGPAPGKPTSGVNYSQAGGAAVGAIAGAVYANQSSDTQEQLKYTNMGVQYGSQFGIMGAVIGLIIGGIIDAIVEETVSELTIYFSHGTMNLLAREMGDRNAVKELSTQLKAAWTGLENSWADIFDMLGMNFYDYMKDFSAQMAADNAETFADDTGNKPWADISFDDSDLTGGGSVIANFKKFLEDQLPQEMFYLVRNMLGEGLSNLGVADEKIRGLLDYWANEIDGSALTESVKRYVLNIVQMVEAFAFLGQSGTDLMAGAEAAVNQSAMGAFDEMFQQIVDYGDVVREAFDFEDQQAKIANLNQMMSQLRQTEMQYLQQLYQQQQQINKSLEDQMRGIERMGWSSDQIISADMTLLDGLMAQLATATPETAAALVQQIQALVSEIFGAAGENGGAYQAQLYALLQEAQALYNARVQTFADELAARNAGMQDQLQDILDLQLNAATETADGLRYMSDAAAAAAMTLWGVAGGSPTGGEEGRPMTPEHDYGMGGYGGTIAGHLTLPPPPMAGGTPSGMGPITLAPVINVNNTVDLCHRELVNIITDVQAENMQKNPTLGAEHVG